MNHARTGAFVLFRVMLAVALSGVTVTSSAAQTITGTLMEVETGSPISLGLIIMMTESGDSITSGVSNARGRFSVAAPDGGSFILLASAFGFKETAAGVFEIGESGEMDVEFRIAAAPMPIDGILVSLQRPALEHQLVKNGFVRRVTRGFGAFITPVMIEESTARSAADLFRGIPGVLLSYPQGGLNAFEGETVKMTGIGQYCTPTVYLDGARMSVQMTQDMPIDLLAPLAMIDAIEIYRRPAEVPIEYGMTSSGDAQGGPCGVIVVWTKTR
jgi:TonB-dependent Receptor Plug Domain